MHFKRSLLIAALLGMLTLSLPSCASTRTSSLQQQIKDTTVLRVRDGVLSEDPEKVLLEVNDKNAIRELVANLKFDETHDWFHCMCLGTERLEFYDATTMTASLIMHHGQSLRWNNGPWEGDAMLTPESAGFLLKWLDERGVHGPMQEVEESNTRREESNVAEKKWLAAMPGSLQPYWSKMGDPFSEPITDELDNALKSEYPDDSKRILALLSWYGSGKGLWSGYPSYESHPEELLLQFKTTDILKAIEGRELSVEQTEGAARLFGGWSFKEQRPDDNKLIPSALKKKLLEHSLTSDSEDKRGWAERAFGVGAAN